MTRQISNHFIYNREEFVICRPSVSIERDYQTQEPPFPRELDNLFKALDNPSHRDFFCTGCYSGYIYSYLYENGQLFLDTFKVMLNFEVCPEINGVKPIKADSKNTSGLQIFSAMYYDLKLKIQEPCSLLIGRGLSSVLSWSPLAETSEFQTVYYLRFENGHLIQEAQILSHA